MVRMRRGGDETRRRIDGLAKRLKLQGGGGLIIGVVCIGVYNKAFLYNAWASGLWVFDARNLSSPTHL